MELWAITSDRGQASNSDLAGIASPTEDSASSDAIQADADAEALFNDVFGELERRERNAATSYPFELDARGSALRLRRATLTDGQTAYVFCLLVSEYRRAQLLPKSAFTGRTSSVEDLFQVCSTIAAAGLLGGSAVSFGFPRPDGSGFLTALQRTYEHRMGEGETEKSARPGVSSKTKDGGIDIVAWRQFPDGLPGKLYLLGQCASGSQYPDKGVRSFLTGFHGDWFTRAPGSPPIEALFVPFVLDHDLTVRRDENRAEARHGLYLSLARDLGVLVDRCRLAYLVDRGISHAATADGEVDRLAEMCDVRDWVNAVLATT